MTRGLNPRRPSKIPVSWRLFRNTGFDPASPKEAGDIAYYALKYSYEHKVPVILRSTHRVSHARESIELFAPGSRKGRTG